MPRFPLLLTAILVLLTPLVRGQTLAPELAQIDTQRETAVKALDTSREAELARLQKSFLAELEAAEKTATSAGRVAELTAITHLREDVTKGATSPSAAAGASKLVAKQYADFLSAVDRMDRQYQAQYERADATFLRALSQVEGRVPANSPLREQMAGLKGKLFDRKAAAELPGVWILKCPDVKWSGKREFLKDGTFTWEFDPPGKWRLTARELVLEYSPGKIERFEWPMQKGELVGVNGEGRKLFFTKKK